MKSVLARRRLCMRVEKKETQLPQTDSQEAQFSLKAPCKKKKKFACIVYELMCMKSVLVCMKSVLSCRGLCMHANWFANKV